MEYGNYGGGGRNLVGRLVIPDSVLSIEGRKYKNGLGWIGAFEGCSSITSVEIPNSVTFVGDAAFARCTDLLSVTIPSSMTAVSAQTFDRCTALSAVTIADSVASIGSGAFNGCAALMSIRIPSSVASIEQEAFQGCVSLTEIVIPNSVTRISFRAFKGCTGLISVIIPDSVTCIEEDAFAGCAALLSVAFPDSLTSIAKYAFAGCIALKSLHIPDSVNSIDHDAFAGCAALTSASIPDAVAYKEEGNDEGASGSGTHHYDCRCRCANSAGHEQGWCSPRNQGCTSSSVCDDCRKCLHGVDNRTQHASFPDGCRVERRTQNTVGHAEEVSMSKEQLLAAQVKDFLANTANLKCPFNRTKVVFAGRGRAGKTSTISSLRGQAFDRREKSTRGADIHDVCTVQTEDFDAYTWEQHVPKDNIELHVRAQYLARYQNGDLSKEELSDTGMLQHLEHLLDGDGDNAGGNNADNGGGFVDFDDGHAHRLSVATGRDGDEDDSDGTSDSIKRRRWSLDNEFKQLPIELATISFIGVSLMLIISRNARFLDPLLVQWLKFLGYLNDPLNEQVDATDSTYLISSYASYVDPPSLCFGRDPLMMGTFADFGEKELVTILKCLMMFPAVIVGLLPVVEHLRPFFGTKQWYIRTAALNLLTAAAMYYGLVFRSQYHTPSNFFCLNDEDCFQGYNWRVANENDLHATVIRGSAISLALSVAIMIYKFLSMVESHYDHVDENADENAELLTLAAKYREEGTVHNGVVLSLWDLGGQAQFSALHHEFLSPSAIYVVVFSLEELLYTPGTALSSVDPLTQTQNIATNETKDECLRELKQWLDCIFCFALNRTDVHHAPVLVVGTCRDKFTEAELATAQSIIKDKVLRRTPCWKSGMVEQKNGEAEPCFFVDNTDQHETTPLKHVSIANLRNTIQTLTEDHEKCQHIVEKVPIKWLHALQRLKEVQTDQKQQRVPFEQVVDIARQCEMGRYPKTPLEQEVNMMLNKFHQLGAVCWRSHGKLANIVVLDPKWLIDAVTVVVRDFKLHPLPDLEARARSDLLDDWDVYLQEGKVSADLLRFIYVDASGYQEAEFEMVQEMMTMFGLLVKVEGGLQFYVPSLLSRGDGGFANASASLQDGSDRKSLACHFWFASKEDVEDVEQQQTSTTPLQKVDLGQAGLYPPGIFDRVLGILLSGHAVLCHKQGRRACLTYGVGQFVIEDSPAENHFTLTVRSDWNPKWLVKMVADAVKEVIKYSFACSNQSADLCFMKLVKATPGGVLVEIETIDTALDVGGRAGDDGGVPSSLYQAWNHTCVEGAKLPEGIVRKPLPALKRCPQCRKDIDAIYVEPESSTANKRMCSICSNPTDCIMPCVLFGTPSAGCAMCTACIGNLLASNSGNDDTDTSDVGDPKKSELFPVEFHHTLLRTYKGAAFQLDQSEPLLLQCEHTGISATVQSSAPTVEDACIKMSTFTFDQTTDFDTTVSRLTPAPGKVFRAASCVGAQFVVEEGFFGDQQSNGISVTIPHAIMSPVPGSLFAALFDKGMEPSIVAIEEFSVESATVHVPTQCWRVVLLTARHQTEAIINDSDLKAEITVQGPKDSGVKLVVPAGTFSESTTVCIEIVERRRDGPPCPVTPVARFSATAASFNHPIQVTMPHYLAIRSRKDRSFLPVHADDFLVCTRDSETSALHMLPAKDIDLTIDDEHGLLQFETSHFSPWWAEANDPQNLDFNMVQPITKGDVGWTNDGDFSACEGCARDFKFFCRKHHCRSCGKIFCDDCSSKKIEMKGGGDDGTKHRCCGACFERFRAFARIVKNQGSTGEYVREYESCAILQYPETDCLTRRAVRYHMVIRAKEGMQTQITKYVEDTLVKNFSTNSANFTLLDSHSLVLPLRMQKVEILINDVPQTMNSKAKADLPQNFTKDFNWTNVIDGDARTMTLALRGWPIFAGDSTQSWTVSVTSDAGARDGGGSANAASALATSPTRELQARRDSGQGAVSPTASVASNRSVDYSGMQGSARGDSVADVVAATVTATATAVQNAYSAGVAASSTSPRSRIDTRTDTTAVAALSSSLPDGSEDLPVNIMSWDRRNVAAFLLFTLKIEERDFVAYLHGRKIDGERLVKCSLTYLQTCPACPEEPILIQMMEEVARLANASLKQVTPASLTAPSADGGSAAVASSAGAGLSQVSPVAIHDGSLLTSSRSTGSDAVEENLPTQTAPPLPPKLTKYDFEKIYNEKDDDGKQVAKVLGAGSFGEVRLWFACDTPLAFDVAIKRAKQMDAITNPSQKQLDDAAAQQAVKEATITKEAEMLKLIYGLGGYGMLKETEVEGAGTVVITGMPDVVGVWDDMIVTRFYERPLDKLLDNPKFTSFIGGSHAMGIMKSLVKAVVWLHEKGVAHCDIKPGNVMCQQGTKIGEVIGILIDFGSAANKDVDRATHVATSLYLTPSMRFDGSRPESRICALAELMRADVYALGLVAWELLYRLRHNDFDATEKTYRKYNPQLHWGRWEPTALHHDDSGDFTDRSAAEDYERILQQCVRFCCIDVDQSELAAACAKEYWGGNPAGPEDCIAFYALHLSLCAIEPFSV